MTQIFRTKSARKGSRSKTPRVMGGRPSDPDELLSIGEVARLLGLTSREVYRLIKRKKLPAAVMQGGCCAQLVRRKDVIAKIGLGLLLPWECD